jgi:hypothetical protein
LKDALNNLEKKDNHDKNLKILQDELEKKRKEKMLKAF